MTAMLLVGLVGVARCDDKPADDLSTEQIFNKVQTTYDSMTSYSDKGRTVTLDSDTQKKPFDLLITFSTKLARPNLYRIEWDYIDNVSTITKKDTLSAWSAGEGDFWDIGKGAEKQKSLSWTLLRRGGDSGGATSSIPLIFFNVPWNHLLEEFGSTGKREDDEKIGDADCYVFFKGNKDDQVKLTLWIGKQDNLIYQFRSETVGQDNVTSTQTFSDIVINQKFVQKDFAP